MKLERYQCNNVIKLIYQFSSKNRKKDYIVEKGERFNWKKIDDNTELKMKVNENKRFNVNTKKNSFSIEEKNSSIINDVKANLIENNAIECIKISIKTCCDFDIYGMGQQDTKELCLNNSKGKLRHENTTIAMPFLLSSKGVGILLDINSVILYEFDDKNDLHFFVYSYSDYIPIYFFLGCNIKNVLKEYWNLTGPAPMLPKWTFGFWQSKMRYSNKEELLNVVRNYRKNSYPLDIIVIDFYHWKHMGDMDFDDRYWPDVVGMFQELNHNNVKCMISIWPYISTTSKNYGYFNEKKLFIHDNNKKSLELNIFNNEKAALIDEFNHKARKHIWKIAKKYYDFGVKIWWLDSCEPDHGTNINEFVGKGINSAAGNYLSLRNAYPLKHAQAFYCGQKSADNENRVLSFARAAYPGCQRYSVAVWSGDIGHDFNALRKQIRIGLNATMSGLPYWTTDIGGFTGGDPDEKKYVELFIRWFQYGTFCPIFRVHGARGAKNKNDLIKGISRGDNEIWSFGEEAMKIMLNYLRLRYSLIPYIYSYMKITCETGVSIMRAMVLEFPNDEKNKNIDDQFMFGSSIMVCPIIKRDACRRRVYFPIDNDWYDYETNSKFNGGKIVSIKVKKERIPLFIKAGSIIIYGKAIEYIDSKQDNFLKLFIYEGEDVSFEYYNDDGKTESHLNFEYIKIKFNWFQEEQLIEIGNAEGNWGLEQGIQFLISVINGHDPVFKKNIFYTGSLLKIHKTN